MEEADKPRERRRINVMCGLPQGLLMRVHDIRNTGNADDRRIAFPREGLELKHGANEVDFEFAAAWYRENMHSDLIANGIISGFPLDHGDDTVGQHNVVERPEVESRGVEHGDEVIDDDEADRLAEENRLALERQAQADAENAKALEREQAEAAARASAEKGSKAPDQTDAGHDGSQNDDQTAS